MFFNFCVVLFLLALDVERTFCRSTSEYVYPPITSDNKEPNDLSPFPNNNDPDRGINPKYINDLWEQRTDNEINEYVYPPKIFSDNEEPNDLSPFPNNNDPDRGINPKYINDLREQRTDREINDINFWLNQWNNRGHPTEAPRGPKPSKPLPPLKPTRKPSKPATSNTPPPSSNGNNAKPGKISADGLDEEESSAKPSTATSSTTTSETRPNHAELDQNMSGGGGGGGGGGSGAGGLGFGVFGLGVIGKGGLDTLGAGAGSGGSGPNFPKGPTNPSNKPPIVPPLYYKDKGKNEKGPQRDKNKKEEDDEPDLDLDDIFDEDDFIDYNKFAVKLHSQDNITDIFKNKFKRIEYVSDWLATNLTNELNNLTVFKEKYQDMVPYVQHVRDIYGNKIEKETDNDIYNQMVEAYNAGDSMERCFTKFNEQIETIERMLTHFADAASIVENESYRIKDRIVETILKAKNFRHQIYKTVGAVRVLAGVSKLRILDCLSPYIPVYQIWQNSMKRLYLEGILLERNTYKSLNREHYAIPTEWRKAKETFTKFIERANNELQLKNIDVQALREPIYNCAANITKYMFDKTKKIMIELRANLY